MPSQSVHSEGEGGEEDNPPQHQRVHADGPAPYGALPVEELHPGWDRDQEGRAGEERQVDGAGDEHVVGPHGDREDRDAQGRANEAT